MEEGSSSFHGFLYLAGMVVLFLTRASSVGASLRSINASVFRVSGAESFFCKQFHTCRCVLSVCESIRRRCWPTRAVCACVLCAGSQGRGWGAGWSGGQEVCRGQNGRTEGCGGEGRGSGSQHVKKAAWRVRSGGNGLKGGGAYRSAIVGV